MPVRERKDRGHGTEDSRGYYRINLPYEEKRDILRSNASGHVTKWKEAYRPSERALRLSSCWL